MVSWSLIYIFHIRKWRLCIFHCPRSCARKCSVSWTRGHLPHRTPLPPGCLWALTAVDPTPLTLCPHVPIHLGEDLWACVSLSEHWIWKQCAFWGGAELLLIGSFESNNLCLLINQFWEAYGESPLIDLTISSCKNVRYIFKSVLRLGSLFKFRISVSCH